MKCCAACVRSMLMAAFLCCLLVSRCNSFDDALDTAEQWMATRDQLDFEVDGESRVLYCYDCTLLL